MPNFRIAKSHLFILLFACGLEHAAHAADSQPPLPNCACGGNLGQIQEDAEIPFGSNMAPVSSPFAVRRLSPVYSSYRLSGDGLTCYQTQCPGQRRPSNLLAPLFAQAIQGNSLAKEFINQRLTPEQQTFFMARFATSQAPACLVWVNNNDPDSIYVSAPVVVTIPSTPGPGGPTCPQS